MFTTANCAGGLLLSFSGVVFVPEMTLFTVYGDSRAMHGRHTIPHYCLSTQVTSKKYNMETS